MSKLIVANLKMNLRLADVSAYIKSLDIENKDVIVCPSTIYIPYFMRKGYSVGLQNISSNNLGDYTGEVSSTQASSMGIKYTLVGHLEGRINLKETEIDINNKVKLAISNNMTPILCIGETKEEKDLLKTEKIIKKQLISALRDIKDVSKIIIAYDPLWEIKKDDVSDIEEIINFIKNIIELNFKTPNIKVICGGITKLNIDEISKISSIDGYLVGKDSIDVGSLKQIIEVAVS